MSFLNDKVHRMFITGLLHFKKNAVMKIDKSDGTVAEIDLNELANLDAKSRIVNVTAATLTITKAQHEGKTVTLNRAAGQAVTLPAATGNGDKYRFFLGTTITSNTTTVKVVGDDVMSGLGSLAQDAADTTVMFETAASDDTITFNGTTTGGIKGAVIELEDVAADLWAVSLRSAATGTEATPFSATV